MSAVVVGKRVVKQGAGKVVLSREDLKQLVLDLVGNPAKSAGRTFGQLAADWLRRISPRRVEPKNEERHIRHMQPLAAMRERELTKGAIDDLVATLLKPKGPLGPASVNKVRSTGNLIIRDAQGNGEWTSLNPFDLIRRLPMVKVIHPTLTREEIARVLPMMRADRRRLSKTILLAGLRPGEGLGLKKEDIDLGLKMIKICRSHGRNQTKNGKEREFPVPDDLVEDLRSAMAESSGPYVFPKADGFTRQRKDTKLAKMLRTAMAAAGVILGFRYTCRRKGCAHKEMHAVSEPRRCPDCDMKLWVEPVPKRLRFYDLRHSSATLHRKAKCDPLVVREMMGHGSTNQTDATYTHLDADYQRIELNKLKLTTGLLPGRKKR